MKISSLTETRRNDPAYQVFTLLRIGFTVAPIPACGRISKAARRAGRSTSLLALVSDEI
jgi:hypothetical protein